MGVSLGMEPFRTLNFATTALFCWFIALSSFLAYYLKSLFRLKTHHGFSFNFIDPKSKIKK